MSNNAFSSTNNRIAFFYSLFICFLFARKLSLNVCNQLISSTRIFDEFSNSIISRMNYEINKFYSLHLLFVFTYLFNSLIIDS